MNQRPSRDETLEPWNQRPSRDETLEPWNQRHRRDETLEPLNPKTMNTVSIQKEQPVVKPWSVTNEKIALATQRLIAAADPVCVILFGSQARGNASQESDADFLVVERKVEDRFSELARLRHSLKGLLLPADILVIDQDGFMRLREEPGSVYYHAYREGRCLYGTA